MGPPPCGSAKSFPKKLIPISTWSAPGEEGAKGGAPEGAPGGSSAAKLAATHGNCARAGQSFVREG
eukprot:1186936-Prorocentrum_minimum.AAC.3